MLRPRHLSTPTYSRPWSNPALRPCSCHLLRSLTSSSRPSPIASFSTPPFATRTSAFPLWTRSKSAHTSKSSDTLGTQAIAMSVRRRTHSTKSEKGEQNGSASHSHSNGEESSDSHSHSHSLFGHSHSHEGAVGHGADQIMSALQGSGEWIFCAFPSVSVGSGLGWLGGTGAVFYDEVLYNETPFPLHRWSLALYPSATCRRGVRAAD